MFWTALVTLLLLWALGIVTTSTTTTAGSVYLLLAAVLAGVVFRVIQRRHLT